MPLRFVGGIDGNDAVSHDQSAFIVDSTAAGAARAVEQLQIVNGQLAIRMEVESARHTFSVNHNVITASVDEDLGGDFEGLAGVGQRDG